MTEPPKYSLMEIERRWLVRDILPLVRAQRPSARRHNRRHRRAALSLLTK